MVSLRPDYQAHKPPRISYLRSFLPYILLLLIFSFFLSSLSLLGHFRSPAAKQQIGWQSWDVVEVSSSGGGVESGKNGTDSGGEEEDFVPSIPLDNWDPLSVHTTGLTEIAIKACYFPPYLFGSYCAPETTPELDKNKGKWVIVERDLNLRTGLWYLNIYYRRTRRLDVPLITDLRIMPEPPTNNETLSEIDGWIKAAGDIHSGVWPTQPEGRLWYRVKAQGWDGWRKSAEERRDERGLTKESDYQRQWMDEDEYITELDVVYGDTEPFFGFERVQGGKVMEAKEQRWESVDIAFRRGNPVPSKAPTPHFHANGTFKIMQIADLHYSVGTGECRDTDKSPCIGDEDTAEWLGEALDAEKPDLVVFSGDQQNGQHTSYDSRSVFGKFAKPVIDRGIAWCAVFGNHDSEDTDDRAYQMRLLQNMPYSLAKAGPEAVDGVGNYLIKLYSRDASRMHLFTLYFLDSHARQKASLPWVDADYDYLKTSQIEWFLNASSTIQPIERPFTPDGASDLDKTTKLAKPNAIMWFHIPLPEANNPADTAGFDGDELDVGTADAGLGASKHNSGFFYNAIKAAFESEVSQENEWYGEKPITEVKVLGHGHTHNTDRCRRTDGIWICFNGGSSYSGYGLIGFDRRVRVYQLSDYGEKVETYKRLTSGEVIDRQVLVGSGAPDGVGQDQS